MNAETKGASAYGGMRNGMEEKRVCSYCGTIFDSTLEKCPLCGSRTSTVSEVEPEEEKQQRPVRRTGGGGKYAAPRRSNKKKKEQAEGKGNKALVAAVIILAIAVLLVLYFIGDMIGWWPGLENLVQRETFDPSATETKEGLCTQLDLSQTGKLTFAEAGESQELTVSINLDCEEEISVSAAKTGLVQIVPKTDKPVDGVEKKTMTYIVTAVAAGQTELTVTCGEQKAVCQIDCAFGTDSSAPDDPSDSSDQTEPSGSSEPSETEDDNFEPKLNYSDVSLFSAGETFNLKVTNLPEGAEVTWSSADEEIATVDENGKVKAISSGTTYIIAEVNGKTAKMVVRCSIEDGGTAGSASLNYTDVTIGIGETFYLRLYDANDERITEGLSFSISNASVATLEDNGVTGVSAGTTTVTVTYNGEEYTCIVRVRG